MRSHLALVEERTAALSERVRSLERERAAFMNRAEADAAEIARLQDEIAQCVAYERRREEEEEAAEAECLRRANEEKQHEMERLIEDAEAKDASIKEAAATIEKLEKEIDDAKRLTARLWEENEAKAEETRKLARKIDLLNAEWNDKIEGEKEGLRSQYEGLLKANRVRNEDLRSLCARTNESVAETEKHNRELLKRIQGLERELEHTTQQLRTAKEESAREKHLFETKAKATVIKLEMKCQTEIEDLKASFEEEKRKMYSFLALKFACFFDPRQSFDTQLFSSVIEKASTELGKLRETDAALRRLLCLSADESTEDAVSKLLLALYRQ
jgi:chromosome segregation ATPase